MNKLGFMVAVFFSLVHPATAAQDDRPNILFIMSDDHAAQAVSAYGGMLSKVNQTYHIDRLAREGMLFNNCFVTNSICTPSRSSIMTGKYAHKTGVYKFTALDQSQPTLAKAMRQNGYNTAIVGKYHLHSNPVGFEYFSVLPGQGDYHDPEFVEVGDEHPSGWIQQGKRTRYEGHSSDVITSKALDFLREQESEDRPFILFCHFKAPHDTWEYARRYEDYLADENIPEPENLFDDYTGRSDALKKTLQFIGSEWGNHTNFEDASSHLSGKARRQLQYQLYLKKYLRCVKGIDDNVGRILNYLDSAGLAGNTVVIYTSDQGFYLGEHGLYDKRFMYEEGLRMPLLVRWPDKIEPGSVNDGMVLNVDFAPTILEIVGGSPLADVQGRSFLPLLKGQIPLDWRKSMYYRYYFSHFDTEPHYGVRTDRYKLIHFDRIDQWELYDLDQDRLEMHNLYNEPAHERLKVGLKAELHRLQRALDDNPDDDGSRPRLGSLSGKPFYQSTDVTLDEQDKTILLRFRSKVGGTLFSTCRIGDVPWSADFEGKGRKTLFIRDGILIFNDGFDDQTKIETDEQLNDDEWHTVAMVVRDGHPHFYVNGLFRMNIPEKMSDHNPAHTFNIGAGIDFNGNQGYNFIGSIAEIFIYEASLDDEVIMSYSDGINPNEDLVFKWINSH